MPRAVGQRCGATPVIGHARASNSTGTGSWGCASQRTSRAPGTSGATSWRAHSVAEVALCHPALAPALIAAAEVASATVGLPGAQLMGTAGGLTRRTRLAVNLANWQLNGDRDQMQADQALIDGLSTPPRGFGRFLVRSFLLKAGTGGRRATPTPGSTFRFALLRAGHPFKLVIRLMLAVVRARAPRRF